MLPKYFDAHTHLNMQFDNDPSARLGTSWQEVGERAIKNGVWFVNVGADEASSKLALEQVKQLDDNCWATVGLHPTESGNSDFAVIKELAKDPKVVAIGECGLEYFKLVGDIETEKTRQKELFKKHIDLALEVGKPLMIHCRASEKSTDAYDDILEILKNYKEKRGSKLRFNMHFFTSDWPTAQKFLELGGYLSFPGVITFSSQYDEAVKKTPLDRIMAETDAPFATPVPHRGQHNEPAYVSYVAERIAKLRLEPKEEVLESLVVNTKRFYGLI